MSGLGHLGLGLAAKKAVPKMHIIVLLMAPMLLDILWVIFSMAGMDASVWTHGLFMATVWSVAGTMLVGLLTRHLRTGITIGLLIFSHWVVDFITHPMGFIFPKDTGVPLLFSGSPLVGLGMYNTLAGVIIGEVMLIMPGIVIYVMTSRKLNKDREMRLSVVRNLSGYR